MQLFCGSASEFVAMEAQRQLVDHMKFSFFEYFRYRPSPSEENSWKNSLHALAVQFNTLGLDDHGVLLEMQLPLSSSRLDCMITGKDKARNENAVIIELKQWSQAFETEEDQCVLVDYGGHGRVQPHPSVQAESYAEYLRDNKAVFHEQPAVKLEACSWLHNFQPDPTSTLMNEQKFGTVLKQTPMFTAADGDKFAEFLEARVGIGDGMPVLQKIVSSRYAPSKKLLEHTARMIKGERAYVLLDDQLVAYQKVLAAARRAAKRKTDRTVIVIEGGPGTGKSVIALNVMAELLSKGEYNVQHATGSRAFTLNLRKILGSKAGAQFKYFNGYTSADAGDIDVLLCDEAHRIRESSNNWRTPKALRSERAQIDELLHASKVSVFFIDDKQVVRPGEIGSSTLIREAAIATGARFETQRLQAQFRCAGSDAYIDWLDNLLEIRDTDEEQFDPNVGFEFRIFDDVVDLDTTIALAAKNGAARMTAGYCWQWSDASGGRLIDDVVIGKYRRPWNAKPEAVGLPRNVPKSNFWATDPNGINQIGCVYTAQGFEFDYVGVIWGRDLVYRAAEGGWVAIKAGSADKEVKRAPHDQFAQLVKNTYRVLLTRGMKGCYVYFCDEETRDYVRSRLFSAEDIEEEEQPA